MRRLLVTMAAALLLSPLATMASADEDQACYSKCDQTYEACMAAINSPNDVEADDAKAVCEEARVQCHDACSQPKEIPQEQEQQEQQQ